MLTDINPTVLNRLSLRIPKFLCLLVCLLQAHILTAQQEAYLFSYFTDNGEDGLHLAWSTDGKKWQALAEGRSFLQPKVGESQLMRDPCITQTPDGTFHMVWTTSWSGRTIGYANSRDLINWSEQMAIPVMSEEDSTVNCWAPEINYIPDSGQFIIYWASTITNRFAETSQSHPKGNQRNHRLYYTLTSDFQSFTPSQLLYEPGFSVIDGSIYPLADGTYAMFIKNETELPLAQKNIRLTYADRITGPYSEPGPPITGDYWAEGPTALLIGNTWHLYFDKYVEGSFGLLTSTDLQNWKDESAALHVPPDIRHGTAFSVPADFLRQLKAQTDMGE
jgi:beta-xylosidase